LEDFEGNRRHAVYSDFSVGDESSNYILSFGVYSGNAGWFVNEKQISVRSLYLGYLRVGWG